MTQNGKILSGLVLVLILTMPGCYTQLMTPQEFTQVRREQLKAEKSDASFSLNYQQNCVSCHSRSELDDRYLDLQYYGVTSVHGISLNPIAWSGSEYYSPYDEIYFAPRPDLVTPWWLPPAVFIQGSGTSIEQGQSAGRPRITGSTRDTKPDRGTVQASPPSTTNSTGTTTAPPPAVSTTPSATQTPSSSTDTDRTRSDSGNTTGNRTRTDGSTRDDGNRPR
jgi:hypothetical protein